VPGFPPTPSPPHAGKGADAIDHAIAKLAYDLIEARGQISDAQLAAARLAGLDDDARIVEIVAAVAPTR
jgi:hypothetical protein